MKKNRFRKPGSSGHSVFTSWLASYCLLLFVPILVSSIIYLEGKNILEKETYNVNGAILKQVQISMDNAFNDVNLLVYKTGLNNKLLLFMSKSLDKQNLDRALMQDVIRYLVEYKVDSAYAEDIYVYMQGLDMVLSTSGLRDADAYFDYIYRNNPMYEGLSFEQWNTMMKGNSGGVYLTLPRTLEGGDTGQTMLYMQSIPFNDSRRNSAMIVVKLADKKIKEVMSGITAFPNSTGMVLDAGGKTIFHLGSTAWSTAGITYDRLEGDTGSLQMEDVNGQRLAVTYIRSKYYGMKYVMAVPYSVFWSKVEYIKTLALVSVGVCIMLGGVLAYLFARKNYNPVNALLRILERRALLLRVGRANEYQLIASAMDKALSENETITLELRQHAVVLRSVFLNKLLKGRLPDKDVLEKGMAAYGIDFNGQNFAVMLFLVRERRETGGPANPVMPQEDTAAVYQIIGGLFKETAPGAISGCFCEADDMLCCIANFTGCGEDEKRSLYSTAQGIQEMVRENRDLKLSVSVSSVHGSIYGIPEAYQEALSVMDYKLTTRNDAVFSYEETKDSPGDYGYTMETEQKLVNSIKAGNTEAAEAILNDVFDRNLSARPLSRDLMKCMLFDITATMLKTLPEIGSIRNTTFIQDMDIAGRLIRCETINDMKTQMSLILRQVCGYIQRNRTTRKDELIKDIAEYVNASYGSPNLNVSFLADKYNLTPAYLTHLFREATAESLFDFIYRIRMEKAKEMLKDERHNIKEVAEKVGYLNSAIFIRAFKKFEGVTPGSYKEMI